MPSYGADQCQHALQTKPKSSGFKDHVLRVLGAIKFVIRSSSFLFFLFGGVTAAGRYDLSPAKAEDSHPDATLSISGLTDTVSDWDDG